jgi:glycerol-3-phosphate O-acyltransferase/dihydroxyacetone phosphate acyltransferase
VWLLPFFPRLADNALKVFYRFEVDGERVPADGPVLLVANHPNSLLDPAMVVAVARRPVRFLAKAPLFDQPGVGWLVKGAGAIPVYRRQDDPGEMARNADTFRAVWEALGEGAAVGIFPEGISHNEPALVPLKTGAARIALGAARRVGGAFPVVPVGLSFRRKERFRSDALALVGTAVEWDDLATAGPENWDAVDELTRRIDLALREVTLNLERWEDAPLVETAEAVFAAEYPVEGDPAERVARLREAADGLARLRAENRHDWNAVAREVAAHARILRVLGLTPRQLRRGARLDVAARWVARQLVFFGLGAPAAALGIAAYYLPYRLTGLIEARAKPPKDVRATFKVLVGGLLCLLWTLGLAGGAGWKGGWLAFAAVLLGLPLVGVTALHVTEQWKHAVGEARRFLLRARRRPALAELRERQHFLAGRLAGLWREVRLVTPFEREIVPSAAEPER